MITSAISTRLNELRDQITARSGSFPDNYNPFTRDVALWRAMKPGRSVMQIRAAMLKELIDLAPIQIP